MKDQLALVISLVITFTCGCSGNREYEKLATESSVVILCKNHVKDGLIWAEIVEVWRDESHGAFTNKVADTLETHVPVDPSTSCGETSILFFGRLKGRLFNYRTLYVHDGQVSGEVTVETFKAMIKSARYSGKELEIPCRPGGDTEHR